MLLNFFRRRFMFWLDNFAGEFISTYLVRSKNYIPDRTIEKFDKLSATMVESGLFQFYLSIKMYQEKLKKMKAINDVSVVGVIIVQFIFHSNDEFTLQIPYTA